MRPRLLARALPGSILALALALPAAPAAAQSGSAEAILESAARRYRSYDSFCADFRQVMEATLLGRTTRSSGRLCQKQPDLFSMRFSDPEGDIVVADGQYVWAYFPSMDPGQVMRSPLATGAGRFDFHREFLENPGRKYAAALRGTESIDGRTTREVLLVPRTPSAYRLATVWIEEGSGLIRRVRIEEENGSVRTVHLSNLDVDPSLSAGFFRFTPPSGAQIINR